MFLAGVNANAVNYDSKDLFAFTNLVPGKPTDLSCAKKFKTAFTPHFAIQKQWRQQIFSLRYSEGYNALTASSTFIGGNANKVNDDLFPEKAKLWNFSTHGLLFNTKVNYQISAFRIINFILISLR